MKGVRAELWKIQHEGRFSPSRTCTSGRRGHRADHQFGNRMTTPAASISGELFRDRYLPPLPSMPVARTAALTAETATNGDCSDALRTGSRKALDHFKVTRRDGLFQRFRQRPMLGLRTG